MRIGSLLAFVALTGAAFAASAEEKEKEDPPARPSAPRRALATGAAVVPGLVAHGAGHWAAGDPDTGLVLLAAEGVGIGMVLGGGTALVLSGASRYLVGPAAAVTALGVGVFGLSFAADVYGVLSSEGGAADLVPRAPAAFESELGYRYISDPRFAYDHFVVERVSLRHAAFRLSPSAWFATGGETARYRLEGAYRFMGLEPGQDGNRSDHLDLVVAGLHHRYVPERFVRTGGELALDARWDLGHLGSSLRGAFADFGVGYGFARIDYDLRGVDVPTDSDSLLLTSFGFGVVLRGRAAPGSEARVYYDHRHDDFAGGLLMPGLGSGVPGKFGAEFRWFFGKKVGLLADVQVGSALVGGISLILRQNEFHTPPRSE